MHEELTRSREAFATPRSHSPSPGRESASGTYSNLELLSIE